MNRLKELARRLLYIGRRRNLDLVLDDEVRFHIESRAGELQQAGLAPGEAMAQARREFGPQARMREESRVAWQIKWIEDLISDLRYAFRALGRSPGFALAAIFSLALGIGANTTIFSLTMEFLFSVPSARQPEQLASIQFAGNSHSPMPVYRFVRDTHTFDGGCSRCHRPDDAAWRSQCGRAQLQFLAESLGRGSGSGGSNDDPGWRAAYGDRRPAPRPSHFARIRIRTRPLRSGARR